MCYAIITRRCAVQLYRSSIADRLGTEVHIRRDAVNMYAVVANDRNHATSLIRRIIFWQKAPGCCTYVIQWNPLW